MDQIRAKKKYYWAIIASSILAPIYIVLIFKGYLSQNTDLKHTDSLTSTVENRGVDFRFGGKSKSKVFYTKFRDVKKKLGVYRMMKNYEALIETIHIGDTLTVYFKDNDNLFENVNIDLIQIERNHRVLFAKSEYERKEASLIYLGLLGMVTNFFIVYHARKTYVKIRNPYL